MFIIYIYNLASILNYCKYHLEETLKFTTECHLRLLMSVGDVADCNHLHRTISDDS